MLDEYIINQINELEEEFDLLNNLLQDLNSQEKTDMENIESLLNSNDLGIEIFSPRVKGNQTKEQVSEIKKHLDDIRLHQMEIMEKISENRQKEEKYQIMLKEARLKKKENEEHLKKIRGQCEASENLDTNVESTDTPGEKNSVTENDKGSQNNSSSREDYLEILRRVENCLNLISHDRGKCKTELRNLRYYLKALLTK